MESAMRRVILGSVGALLAAAPLSLADPPAPAPAFPPPAIAADLPATPLPAPGLPAQLPPTVDVPPAEPLATPPTTGTTPPPTAQPVPSAAAPSCCTEPATKWQDTHVGPREQLWFNAGYRLWWIKDARIPTALVTTGPASGGGQPGAGTTILFGGQDVNYGSFSGLNLEGGLWLDCRHTFGIEIGGFYFGRQDVTATFSSDAAGNPFIARPFTTALTMTPAAAIVSSPGILSGTVTGQTASRLAGANINAVKNLFQCEDYTVDTLYGFRYIDLAERLDVTQNSTPLNGGTLAFNGGALPPGVGLSLADSFTTRNQFYGGLIGTRGELRFGPAFIDLSSTVALGPNHETLQVYGRTTALTPGGLTLPGGLLAVGGGNETVNAANGQPTAFVHQGNIGRYTTNRFIVAPEVGLSAGAYVTSHIKLAVGYNFLYMTDVVRPGQQVNPQIDTRFVPSSPAFGSTSGQPVPTVTGRREDFHAQGVTFSAEVKY
jgi:hypothetical protein